MRYPGNYGFIPHPLSQDGDPCDVIIADMRHDGVLDRARGAGKLSWERSFSRKGRRCRLHQQTTDEGKAGISTPADVLSGFLMSGKSQNCGCRYTLIRHVIALRCAPGVI